MPDLTSNFVNSTTSGNTSTQAFITHFETRNPTPQDINYLIQQLWVNRTTDEMWILEAFSTLGGFLTAVWSKTGSGDLGLETLTGNTGGPVGTDTNHNINVIGDTTTINVVGNPATNTLTASTTGAVATSYVENTGTAVPALGILNVLGGTGISTAGAGNTITITNTLTPSTLTFTEDAGTASPSANNINIFGDGTLVTTAGAGSTVTITGHTATNVPTTFQTDSGNATPAANVLIVHGTNGITTSGAGNTVTIINSITAPLQQIRTNTAALITANGAVSGGGTTPPASGDGTQVLAVTITPKSATSILVVEFQGVDVLLTGNANGDLFFVRGSDPNPFANFYVYGSLTDVSNPYNVAYVVSGTTSALVIQVRAGILSPAAGSVIFNDSAYASSANFTTLIVTEWGS